ncbi:MAG: hypothetical protein LBG59_00400 [Candidatus Peribacteria bacterium]|jgi:hypothetical protein|nr:hypothetical protein [Candidatus Peribacteria bacterium]
MNNAPASNPDQLQSAYHQAVELAYLVVDTLSIASLKELWKRSDFSALDKAMLRMLRRGSEKTQERTASKLVEAMHNETKSISPTALVKYNPLVEDPLTPLFQKRLKKMRTLFADPEVREAFFSGFTDRKEHWELLALGKP